MNKKYFLLIIGIAFSQIEPNLNDSTYVYPRNIEEEKDIKEEKLYNIINRDIDLYHYDISVGSSMPLGSNISNNFKTGKSISLLIRTPYKTPKILNRFIFDITIETYLKDFKPKENGIYNSNYNIFGIYLLLNNEDERKFSVKYGLGFSHINPDNQIAPAFKIKIERELNINKFYSFLINSYILKENENIRLFLKSLSFSLGTEPELLMGFPQRRNEMTLSIGFYFKINLFNL